jgi:signal transduction histidine kinase/ligand-binding sensor domain-containing protein
MLLILVAAVPAPGIDIRQVLAGYSLTSWGQADGLPAGVIWTMAKDRNGYLWLGTDEGLLRFDGLRFLRWQSEMSGSLPSAAVRSLVTARDGSIWVGFAEPGGVSRIAGREVHNYGVTDGLGAGAVTVLLEDREGRMLAGSRSGLFMLEGTKWLGIAPIPGGALYSGTIDQRGQLFVTTTAGVFRLAPSTQTLAPVGTVDRPVRDITWDGNGEVWASDPVSGFRRLADAPPAKSGLDNGQGSRLLFDSRGNLWVGTFGQGLWRVALDSRGGLPRVEKTSTLTGLSSDGIASLLEDADGAIWVGTYDGLNRLAPHKITPILNLDVIRGIERTTDGSAWVGAVDGLLEFPPGHDWPVRHVAKFNGSTPTAMHGDELGRLWVAVPGGLLRFVKGSTPIQERFPSDRAPRQITVLTSDRNGGVWFYDRGLGVNNWNEGRLVPLDMPPALLHVSVTSALVDGRRRLWLALEDGSVVLVDGGEPSHAPTVSRNDAGDVFRVVYEDQQGIIWLGGNHGLKRWSDGRFVGVTTAAPFPTESVIGIVDDRSGNLWIGLEGAGVAAIAHEELGRSLEDPSYPVRFSYYDKSDGFAGAPRWFGDSSTARTEDGRLWFISARGVTVIAPEKLSALHGPEARVEIERVLADAQRVIEGPVMHMPAETSRVEIDYTIPNLSSPLKTQFRYRLDGFDQNWVDASGRRQAVYTNLPPRQYTFRVIATGAGAWTESTANLQFVIEPRFYQTRWFAPACLGLVGAASWGAWRLRVRQMRQRFALLFAERVRLGREIHDTLLQGLFGIGLQCEAIASDLGPSQGVLKERLLRVQQDAESYVREARHSIRDLRSPTLQSSDLVGAVRESTQRMTFRMPLTCDVTVEGDAYRFSPNAEEQVLRISQEALLNVIRHANARHVGITLEYRPSSMLLRVSDDGCGFDATAGRADDGHVGLESMRERARTARGQFKLITSPGRGTIVEVTVPRRHDA